MSNFLIHQWNDPTSRERVELVFANRNKNYGAYQIRYAYEKTTARALIFTCGLFVVFASVPSLMKLFGGNEIIRNIKPDDIVVEYIIPPPPDAIVQPLTPPLPPPANTTTLRNEIPVVVDVTLRNDDGPPTQDDLNKHESGVITSLKDSSTGPYPLPDPVGNGGFNDEIPRTIVQEMPAFPGGESKMYEFLGRNIKYTAAARENNIRGTIFVNFIVGKEGEIKDVKLLSGLGYGLDEEAIRVIRSMPLWSPGRQDGRPVPVSFNMPVNFTIR